MKKEEKEKNMSENKQLAIVNKLRGIAVQQMRKTGYSAQFHTLQNFEVVDEIFDDEIIIEKFDDLVSLPSDESDAADVEEFIKLCTIKIKHYLIDYMRKKFADKRGGNMEFVPLDDALDIFSDLRIRAEEIEYLNDALERLAKASAFHAGIIEKKYFLGMKNREIAERLKVSLSKIEKDSHCAIVWLKRELLK